MSQLECGFDPRPVNPPRPLGEVRPDLKPFSEETTKYDACRPTQRSCPVSGTFVVPGSGNLLNQMTFVVLRSDRDSSVFYLCGWHILSPCAAPEERSELCDRSGGEVTTRCVSREELRPYRVWHGLTPEQICKKVLGSVICVPLAGLVPAEPTQPHDLSEVACR
jgi:hypothetical protein